MRDAFFFVVVFLVVFGIPVGARVRAAIVLMTVVVLLLVDITRIATLQTVTMITFIATAHVTSFTIITFIVVMGITGPVLSKIVVVLLAVYPFVTLVSKVIFPFRTVEIALVQLLLIALTIYSHVVILWVGIAAVVGCVSPRHSKKRMRMRSNFLDRHCMDKPETGTMDDSK